MSGVRLTTDGRFAISSQLGGPDEDDVRVWDVETGRCLRLLDDRPIRTYDLALTPDGRHLLVPETHGTVNLWELEWDLSPREPADWDEAAAPYLDAFLRTHARTLVGDRPEWDPDEEPDLLRALAHAGYGRLRPDGVRAALHARAGQFRLGAGPPLTGSSPLAPGNVGTGTAAPPAQPASGTPEPPIML